LPESVNGLLTFSASSQQFAAAVSSRALGEFEHLLRALGGGVETVLGRAGAGDLFVTCQGRSAPSTVSSGMCFALASG
jgi:glycerol-3-phosphate dehydrogenase